MANLIRKPEQYAASLLRSRACPRAFFEGSFGSRDSTVDVFSIGIRNLGDDLFARGIVDRKCLIGLAVHPLAVDVHLISANLSFYSARRHMFLLQKIL